MVKHLMEQYAVTLFMSESNEETTEKVLANADWDYISRSASHQKRPGTGCVEANEPPSHTELVEQQ